MNVIPNSTFELRSITVSFGLSCHETVRATRSKLTRCFGIFGLQCKQGEEDLPVALVARQVDDYVHRTVHDLHQKDQGAQDVERQDFGPALTHFRISVERGHDRKTQSVAKKTNNGQDVNHFRYAHSSCANSLVVFFRFNTNRCMPIFGMLVSDVFVIDSISCGIFRRDGTFLFSYFL